MLCRSVEGFLRGSTPKSAISYTFWNDRYNSSALPCRLWWIVDFLADRTQCTKVGLNVFLSLDINSSIVQGSGIGPRLFVVYISDLKASGKDNCIICIIKFGDDCSLLFFIGLILANILFLMFCVILSELYLLNYWLIFWRTHLVWLSMSTKLLKFAIKGYICCVSLKMSMSCDCLSVVFDAIVLSKLLYASSAWFGFISVEHLNMIQKLLTKAYKLGLTNKLHCATSLFNMRDRQLFRAMSNSLHCLHHLLPLFRS